MPGFESESKGMELINEQHTLCSFLMKRSVFYAKDKITKLMVYAMICYNISLNIGGMTNQVFLMAFGEMKIMWPAAIILEFFVVEKLSTMLAFRIVSPQDKPIFITLAISSMIVCLMCPMMSFIATLLFKNAGSNFIAVWFQTTVMNFPMALCWQIFGAGPLGRLIFRTVMKAMGKQEVPAADRAESC